jgi:hypothetical protein
MLDMNKLSSLIKDHSINLTEQDIFNFLKIEKRWPHRDMLGEPTVQVINNTLEIVDKDFYKVTGYLDYEKWKVYYDKGFTSLITNVLDLTDELRNLQDKIKYIVGNEVESRFIFSKGINDNSAHSIEYVQDYDVIVKQIYGEGHWKIHEQDHVIKKDETLNIRRRLYRNNTKIDGLNLSLILNIKKN